MAEYSEQPDTEELDAYGEDMRKLCDWSKALDSHWGDWIKETKESFRFVAGDQYEKDEYAALKDGKKIPVTFNRVGPVIDAVVGAEIQGRQQTQFFPRENGDAKINELLTQGAEWLRDLTDAEGEETDMRRDCFICGIGWSISELDYEVDPEGRYTKRRLDPTKVLHDPNARQSCAVDARYIRYREQMSRDEFKDLYGEVQGVFDPSDGDLVTHNADPRLAFEQGTQFKDDLITVDLWQWYEVETVVVTRSQDGTSTVEYSLEDFEQLEQAAIEAGYRLQSQKRRRRRYMTATITGKIWLEEPRQLPFPEFTLKCTTGKRDNERNVWYGLVRPMKDPQKWANAFFSMLLHMVRTNAKGGIIAEEGAMGDQKRFEETFAASDEVTIVAQGALSQNRIMPKPQPAYPAGIDRLMEQAITAIRETSGISPEMLGMADRDQPGILEAQRKQTAYGLLSTFFEGFRRYRKNDGELQLHFMRMLGPETLIRVTLSSEQKQEMMGHNGGPPMEAQQPQGVESDMYVPLALALDSRKYDVVVDEAPAGPNQRERTWLMFTQILPAIADRVSPEMWAEALKYSPFPESFSGKMRELIMASKPDPQQQQMQQAIGQAMAQTEIEGKQLANRKTAADAELQEVKTVMTIMRPDPQPQIIS
jgi:hypothetical protein